MAVWTLKRAFDLLEFFNGPTKEVLTKMGKLTEEELNHWRDITQRMVIPISEEGIIEQFEGYFDLKELDWQFYQNEYEDIHRMDRILKAEGKSANDYKVSKQADALMPFYLLPQEEIQEILRGLGYEVPDNFLRLNFYYYLSRTSHGSTLSRLVHGYLANLIGDQDLSWTLFIEALKSDYQDIQNGTTKEGVHTGVMAGTVIFALKTYAGIDYSSDHLKINPNPPDHWREMRFNLGFKGDRYYFIITKEKVAVKLESEKSKNINIRGHEVTLNPLQWVERDLQHVR